VVSRSSVLLPSERPGPFPVPALLARLGKRASEGDAIVGHGRVEREEKRVLPKTSWHFNGLGSERRRPMGDSRTETNTGMPPLTYRPTPGTPSRRIRLKRGRQASLSPAWQRRKSSRPTAVSSFDKASKRRRVAESDSPG